MIEVVVGYPGGGKGVYLCERALREQKRRPVFSNVPMRGCFKLDPKWFSKMRFPVGALLCVDEASHVWNSRSWQSLDPETYKLFSLHRHHSLDIIFVTQAPDRVDKTIRELTEIWTECSSVRVPLTGPDGPVLYFTRRQYITPEECFSGKEPWRCEHRLPSRWVYESFDTMWMFDQKAREEIVPEAWQFPERPRGVFSRLGERLRKRGKKDEPIEGLGDSDLAGAVRRVSGVSERVSRWFRRGERDGVGPDSEGLRAEGEGGGH